MSWISHEQLALRRLRAPRRADAGLRSCDLPRMLEGRMPDLQGRIRDRGAITRLGSGRTGGRAWLLAVVLAVSLLLPAASPLLPPPEALEDSPSYERWRVLEVKIAADGETAVIRLQHPDNARVVAVVLFRLGGSTVIVVPDGAGGVAPSRP